MEIGELEIQQIQNFTFLPRIARIWGIKFIKIRANPRNPRLNALKLDLLRLEIAALQSPISNLFFVQRFIKADDVGVAYL